MEDLDKPDGPEPGRGSESNADNSPGSSEEEPTCALCGGRIGPDDVVCPHCGESLVAG